MEGDCNVYAHSSLWMRPTRPDRYNAKMVYIHRSENMNIYTCIMCFNAINAVLLRAGNPPSVVTLLNCYQLVDDIAHIRWFIGWKFCWYCCSIWQTNVLWWTFSEQKMSTESSKEIKLNRGTMEVSLPRVVVMMETSIYISMMEVSLKNWKVTGNLTPTGR